MRRSFTLLIVLAILAAPSPARAWGFDGHRFIMDRAIDLLPAPIRSIFDAGRPFVVEHTVDPDLWSRAGFTEEGPRHFLHLDAYGAAPFEDLPRSYERAVEALGVDTVERNGVLPWRAAEVFGWLRDAFAPADGRGASLFEVRFFAAVLAHYVADAYVPFHAVVNFDGQLTGQRGIHARWESELFDRYAAVLVVTPAPVRDVPEIRTLVFDALESGVEVAPSVLAADRAAREAGGDYDAGYFARFFAASGPVLERRLGESVTAVASAIVAAWEQAGRPALSTAPSVPAGGTFEDR